MQIRHVLLAAALSATVAMRAQAGGFALTNELAILSIGADGFSTQLVERATGRVLADGKVPFVRPVLVDGTMPVSRAVEERGPGAWAWTFGALPGEVVLQVQPFAGGWTFEVVAAPVPGIKSLNLCWLRGLKCGRYLSGIAQAASDDASGIALRGYDLYAKTSVTSRDIVALADPAEAPLKGRRVGLAAGRRADLIRALQAMTVAAGVPHSVAGGAWALESEQCKGSYLNANVTAETVDDWIAVAQLGGFDTIHFREKWYACRGHYPVNTNCWPNGLADMKRAVEKIHAAGLRAGLHTLTGCIDPRDPWITPRCSPDLMAWATYTLAEPLAADAKELVVAERPIDRHDVVFTYHGNGNAIRIGEEIVQYTGVRREPPYGFTGLKRGAFGTIAGAHAKGEQADYLQQRYLAFYPKPDSQLARDLAAAIGRVYRTCRFDQIYCDGTEGMMTRYGMAKMRHLILAECTADGRPCLNEDSMAGSLPAVWWFHSRVGAWDSTYWSPKRFHDLHIAQRTRYVRERDMRELQMGWWRPGLWSIHHRPHCADDMEYYAGKNTALDASMSIVANQPGQPMNYSMTRQMAILGWYERFRRAGAFADGVAARLGVPRAEYRLRQDADGVWRMAPIVSAEHCVHSRPAAEWQATFAEKPVEGFLRIEALYAGEPYDSPKALPMMTAADVPGMVLTNATGVTGTVTAADDPQRGKVIRFSAANAGRSAVGAWACAAREFRPYANTGGRRVVAFWVKGDGSGALLNVQVKSPREYGQAHSEHYVTLDFTGWRYMEMPFRETDAARYLDHRWPYGTYSDIFHRVIRDNAVSDVKLYLNDVPAGGRAEVCVSEVRLVPLRDAGCRTPAVTVNGKTFTAPFTLTSGEFAEYGGGHWTHLDKTRLPMARYAAAEPLPLSAGVNRLSFAAGEVTPGAEPRAMVTVFAAGARFEALRNLATLAPERRRLLAREAAEPSLYSPTNGFTEMPPLVMRPGEQAEALFEVAGPIGPFKVTVGGVTQAFPGVAAGKVMRSPAGAFPVRSGTVPVTVRAEDPAAPAQAVFTFTKLYRPPSRAIAVDPARAVIVAAKGPRLKDAVQELQLHLKLITGHDVPVADTADGGRYAFRFEPDTIGGNEEACAWEISADETVFRGHPYFAVVDFLETRLGVRWPEADAISYTAQNPLSLQTGAGAWLPELKLRGIRGRGATNGIFHRRMRSGRHAAPRYGHAFTDYWKRYGKDHRDYFAMRADGIRGPWNMKPEDLMGNIAVYAANTGNSLAMCCTSTGLVAQIVANWLKAGAGEYINLCENDVPGNRSCQCPECKALDVTPAKVDPKWETHYSDRYVYFGNKVLEAARRYRADVKVCYYAYNATQDAPGRQRPDPATCLGLVPTCFTDQYIDAYVGSWKRTGLQHFFYRPNRHHYYVCPFLPIGSEKHFYGILQKLCAAGAIGFDYDARAAEEGGFEWFERYVTLHAMQDPSQPFSHWEDHFCAAYGAAAEDVKAYYRYWREEVWDKRLEPNLDDITAKGKWFNFGRGLLHNLKDYYRADDFDQAEKRLAAAEAKELPEPQRTLVRRLRIAHDHAHLLFNVVTNKTRANTEALIAYRKDHGYPLYNWYEQYFGDITGVQGLLGPKPKQKSKP